MRIKKYGAGWASVRDAGWKVASNRQRIVVQTSGLDEARTTAKNALQTRAASGVRVAALLLSEGEEWRAYSTGFCERGLLPGFRFRLMTKGGMCLRKTMHTAAEGAEQHVQCVR